LAPEPKKVAAPLASSAPTPLTTAERVDTAIEVRNGTWTKDLARQTRSLLHQEGFNVAMIGNHVDFGAAKTVIYYRPEAEKVARAVGAAVFPQAALEPSPKLKAGMDIKILLGADLLERPQLMAPCLPGIFDATLPPLREADHPGFDIGLASAVEPVFQEIT
jgi:hypothetical protein